MIDGKWVFNNTNNEEDSWSKSDFYDSREECIKEAEEYFRECLSPDEPIFIGKCKAIPIPDVDVDEMLDKCDQEYSSHCGDERLEEEWLFPTWDKEFTGSDAYKKFEASVQASFRQFLEDANIQPNLFIVEDVEQIR